jgi:hypothetical protein
MNHTHIMPGLIPLLFGGGLIAQAPLQWRTLPQQVQPRAAAWDSARQTSVLVTSDAGLRQFAWDGQLQRERQHALDGVDNVFYLADDPRHGELVALRINPPEVGRFDGARWTWTSSPISPSLSLPLYAAFDEQRSRLVVLQNSATGTNVIEWDGSSWWATAAVPGGPPPRFDTAFAYEPQGQRCVLYGGGPGGTALDDCWSWDGSSWALLATHAAPGARTGASVAAAPNGSLVLYGGSASTTTWTLAGNTWSQVPTAHDPGPRAFAMMFRDPLGLLLLGGNRTDGNAHRFTGTDWVATTSSFARPLNLSHPIAAYDRARGQCVLLGGADAPPAATWLFDDTWHLASPSQTPPVRGGWSLCWSAADQGVLLFGGIDGTNTEYADTWLWNGTNWQLRSPVNAPSPRHLAQLYEDPTGGVLLLGGVAGITTPTDQWRWNGSDWISMAPTVPPISQLLFASGCFDPLRNRLVLMGLVGTQIETHEWDGNSWSLANSTPLNPNLFGRRLGFEPRMGAIVALGNPAQKWDGATWTSLGVAERPAPAGSPSFLLTDDARQRLLLLTATFEPSIAVASDIVAASTSYGSGCALGPSPTLAAVGDAVPGNMRFAIELGTLAPSVPSFLVLGFGAQNAPLGSGCSSFVGAAIGSRYAPASPGGQVSYDLPIPNASGLLGVQFTAQGVVFEPARSLLGTVTLTAGLRVTVGD